MGNNPGDPVSLIQLRRSFLLNQKLKQRKRAWTAELYIVFDVEKEGLHFAQPLFYFLLNYLENFINISYNSPFTG